MNNFLVTVKENLKDEKRICLTSFINSFLQHKKSKAHGLTGQEGGFALSFYKLI